MSMQRVDRVTFRFTRSELGALLKLMALPPLPDTSVRPVMPESGTVEILIESGVVMVCGERTLVDGTIALVVKSAAGSDAYLAARGPVGLAVLYRAERMCVLLEESGRMITLEPLQNVQAARGPWMDAAARLGGPANVRLLAGGALAGEGQGPEALKALYDQLEAQ